MELALGRPAEEHFRLEPQPAAVVGRDGDTRLNVHAGLPGRVLIQIHVDAPEQR